MQQVEVFKTKISTLLEPREAAASEEIEAQEAVTAKIFEEIKVMFQDLPGRIERRIDPDRAAMSRKGRRMSPGFIEEFVHTAERESDDSIAIVMVTSLFRDEFPWLYDVSVELYRAIESNEPGSDKLFKRFLRLFDLSLRHPLFRDHHGSGRRRPEIEESMYVAFRMFERLMERNRENVLKRNSSPRKGFNTNKIDTDNFDIERVHFVKGSGYEEEACARCGNPTVLRQGSGFVCTSCGATTGTT